MLVCGNCAKNVLQLIFPVACETLQGERKNLLTEIERMI